MAQRAKMMTILDYAYEAVGTLSSLQHVIPLLLMETFCNWVGVREVVSSFRTVCIDQP